MHLPPDTNQSDSTPKPAIEFFDELEIYPCWLARSRYLHGLILTCPASKLKHFKALHERTGIPYNEMLFFDDEHRIVEVEKLG
jgi:magnesium-dependent phosphatase 1